MISNTSQPTIDIVCGVFSLFMSKVKKTTLHVKGMHCPSCDILIAEKFKEESNIKDIKPNHHTQKVEICYTGHLDKETLNKKIEKFGYRIVDRQEFVKTQEPFAKRLTDAAVIGVILFILYYFAQELNLIPSFNSASTLTLTAVFVLGLIASTSTCMATSGALFLATIGKLRRGQESFTQNILPALSFNIGRVVSYGFFGFIIGFLGKTLSYNAQVGSLLTLFVSILMILIGLDMLGLFSFSSLFPNVGGSIFQKLESRLIQKPKRTAFFLGAITYFLPCGFTQTVQVYALGLADPVKSALIMMIFALGTMPMLMAIGFASSFSQSKHYAVFQKVMGIIVFVIGISYLGNFLSLYGVPVDSLFGKKSTASLVNVEEQGGYQIARMSVRASGYYPNRFTVKKGKPVKWIIDGENVFGCQGWLMAPSIGIQKTIRLGENILEFTPEKEGMISFSCSMGMFRGNFNVVSG